MNSLEEAQRTPPSRADVELCLNDKEELAVLGRAVGRAAHSR